MKLEVVNQGIGGQVYQPGSYMFIRMLLSCCTRSKLSIRNKVAGNVRYSKFAPADFSDVYGYFGAWRF